MKPLVKFGVLTDVQYADIPNRPAWYDHSKTRYYRASLDHVKQAFDFWTNKNCSDDDDETSKTKFALQLGDLIDGMNFRHGLDPLEALQRALKSFDSRVPVFHVVGNHELYNFGRPKLVSLLRESLSQQEMSHHPHHDEKHLYYSFSPAEGIKMIALDCFEVSVIGYQDTNDENYATAAAILYEKHGHMDDELWDGDGSLESLDLRFQAQNGGISDKQLAWLERELADSDAKKEKVIVFGHVCLLPDSCDPTCLLWNYDQVISCFSRHPSVVAYLSGHAHSAGHGVDANGIHYLVFHGIIESSPDTQAFSTLTLFDDRLEVEGQGTEPSLSLALPDRYALFENPNEEDEEAETSILETSAAETVAVVSVEV